MRRYLPFAIALVVLGLLCTTFLSTSPSASMPPADGGRVLLAPPPGAPTSPMAVNPATYKYVNHFRAQDINFDLSKPINEAAHRYHLSPVGLLAVALSECQGYTQSPRCDHEWPSQCDFSYGATQINVCTAAQFGVGNGVWDGHYGANATYLRNYEDNAIRAVWLMARVLRSMKNIGGGTFPNIDILYNCGNYSAYIYGTICYSNHAHFLANWWLAARYGTNNKPRYITSLPRAVGNDLLDIPAVEQRLWRIPATYVVESSTIDESGLTGGYQPIRDTDVMVPQWTHQRIYLPGNGSDWYTYRGCLYVAGSGDASLWLTPTDQYFAILHMDGCPFGGVTAGPPIRFSGTPSSRQNDLTGRAFDAIVAKLSGSKVALAAGLRKVRGGTYIGLTGWPSSYQYSNGSCYSEASCGIDSHACFVETSGASDWFLWLAEGHDRPKPKPRFQTLLWDTFRREHHEAPVPAYRKHHLRAEAGFWWQHRKTLGYVTAEEKWHASKRGIGYEVMPFTRANLLFWPKNGHFKIAHR